MYKRIFKINKKSKQSFFLFGPRGTGKTTWLKTNFKKSVYLDLLESKLFRILQASPEKLENYIPLCTCCHFKTNQNRWFWEKLLATCVNDPLVQEYFL